MTQQPMRATWALWEAAGRPRPADGVPSTDPCWWCGRPSPGWARPRRRAIAKTFPDARLARAPDSDVLCAPCGWTLLERIALPAWFAAPRIAMKAKVGRRATVSIGDAPAERYLLLEIEKDGRIGVWSPGPNAKAEAPWHARKQELRKTPESVGVCEFLGLYPIEVLRPAAAEKFRCYHHAVHRNGAWWVGSDSDKPTIRDLLLHPPQRRWACVIGDGKKHAAIYAPASDGRHGLQRVYLQGRVVSYTPEDLRQILRAVEDLVRLGTRDDEIRSGQYVPRPDPEWMATWRSHRGRLILLRRSGLLDLALYLRRPVAALREDPDADSPPPGDLRIPPRDPPAGAGDGSADRPGPTSGRQLGLFG